VCNFKAVEHRLEFVARIAGVDYYNDSKATNVDATIKAIESFPSNVHLILGGKDKGSDYSVLNELLRRRVKRVYTIGAAAAKIESQIQGAAEVERAETLENAVSDAPANVLRLAMSFCLRPRAPASTNSRITNIGGGCSSRLVHALAMARSS
jgi:UDP-N-acetylmuramoylalanine-D-glutamate ligase